MSWYRIPGAVVLSSSLLVPACVNQAQMVLKTPVSNQCESAKLNSCDDIAEGLILFADGREMEGEKKLTAGLSANASNVQELKRFADGLDSIGKIPGAGQYVASLQPAIRLVQRLAEEHAKRAVAAEAARAAEQAAAVGAGTSPESASQPATSSVSRAGSTGAALAASTQNAPMEDETAFPKSTFIMTAGNPLSVGCRFAGTPTMRCLHETVEVPKVVTDVMVSAGCPVDVLVTARRGINPVWLVYAPAGRGVELHAASLPLAIGQVLTVGAAYKDDGAQSDVRCGVTMVWRETGALPSPGLSPK